MASNRHGKVTRIAYRYTLSGKMKYEKEWRVVHATRFYRSVVTIETAILDAIADAMDNQYDMKEIDVAAIDKCVVGADWDRFCFISDILSSESVKLDRS